MHVEYSEADDNDKRTARHGEALTVNGARGKTAPRARDRRRQSEAKPKRWLHKFR